MRKILKPFIALSVVTAFTLSAVICCCALQLDHSPIVKNMDKKMASDPCQKGSSEKKSDSHGYCFVNASASDKVQASAIEAPSLKNTFHHPQAIVAFGRNVHQAPLLVGTAYGGISLPRALSVPLYLQFQNLRL